MLKHRVWVGFFFYPVKGRTLQALPHSCLWRQKMLFARLSRKKTCKALHTLEFLQFAVDLFRPLCSTSVPSSTLHYFLAPSLLLFLPISGVKAEAPRSSDSKGCLGLPSSSALTAKLKAWVWHLDPKPYTPLKKLSRHTKPQASCFQHLPKEHLC